MSGTLPAGFLTQKTKLIGEYDATKAPYIAKTKPYYSTQQFILPVVDSLPTTSPTVAHAVLRVGSIVEWFGYKLGDQIPYGPGGATRLATEADTNLSKPRETNGVEDFVFDGISMTCKSMRSDYSAAAYSGTDADVINALQGKNAIYDPAAIDEVPQLFSPFNLENALWEAIKSAIAIEIEWDRTRVEKIARADAFVEGGGRSYLKASGEPTTANRYRIPEGYLWRRQGMPDDELIVRGTVREPVIVPITLINPSNAAAGVKVPNNLYLDITVRLHGLSLSVPSQN
jgi:hypothetical protein